jgi:phage FluMu protein Com
VKSLEQKIIVRCKNCGWRIFDKVTMTTGVIELKCPNCHRVVEVDLSLRKGTVKYRLVQEAITERTIKYRTDVPSHESLSESS